MQMAINMSPSVGRSVRPVILRGRMRCCRQRNDFRRQAPGAPSDRGSRLNAKFTNPRESWNEMTNVRASVGSDRPAVRQHTAEGDTGGRASHPGLSTLHSLSPSSTTRSAHSQGLAKRLAVISGHEAGQADVPESL